MPTARIPIRAVSALFATTVAAATLTACSVVPAVDDHELTVPVLWASGTAENASGGVEPATVWVGDDDTPGFSVDLRDSEAQGAGPAWQASSGSAAAVGTLYSGVDPARVGVRFSVTGPIDGLSGGAALAVGVMAALQRVELRGEVTMTGTVLPDGSVGEVGAVPTKLRAAAADGFSTVLIPRGNTSDPLVRSGAETDMIGYGRTLGLRVIPVDNLLAAYTEFTGLEIVPVAEEIPALSAPVDVVAQARADAMVAKSELEADASPPLTVAASGRARNLIKQAQRAQAAKRWADAYASAGEAYRLLLSLRVRNAAVGEVKRGGAAGATRRVRQQASAVEQLLRDQVVADSDVGTLPRLQQLGMPTALAPLSRGQAILTRVLSGTSDADSAAEIAAAAVAVAQVNATTTIFTPDAVAVLKASAEAASTGPAVGTFMSGYTNFLIQAADANVKLIGDISSSAGDEVAVDELASLTSELGVQAKAIPKDEQVLNDEVQQSAAAIAYYTASVALPSALNAGLYGSSGTLPGGEGSNQVAVAATRDASKIAIPVLADLTEHGVDPGLSNWLTRVAVASTAGEPEIDPTNAAGRSVVTSWEAVINSLSVRAYVRAG